MKGTTILAKSFSAALAAVVVASLALTFEAMAKTKRGRAARPEMDRKLEREKFEREFRTNEKVRLSEVSRRLNIPAKELSEFFKNGSASSKTAWKELFKEMSVDSNRNATRHDYKNADVLSEMVGSYVRVRKSGLVDNFHIREADLVEINASWTFEQKSNFTRVLRRASEIAQQGSKVTTIDEAFEKALSELGYLEKYRKGCKRG